MEDFKIPDKPVGGIDRRLPKRSPEDEKKKKREKSSEPDGDTVEISPDAREILRKLNE